MPNVSLPDKSEPFSPDGFEKIYEQVRREDLSVRRTIAADIEKNPRRMLQHVFRLSSEQQALLDGVGDGELEKQARVLLEELRSRHPRALRLVPANSERDEELSGSHRLLSCSCLHPHHGG
jgi:hypothetical protein